MSVSSSLIGQKGLLHLHRKHVVLQVTLFSSSELFFLHLLPDFSASGLTVCCD